jgi:hypothetical protein
MAAKRLVPWNGRMVTPEEREAAWAAREPKALTPTTALKSDTALVRQAIEEDYFGDVDEWGVR